MLLIPAAIVLLVIVVELVSWLVRGRPRYRSFSIRKQPPREKPATGNEDGKPSDAA